MVRLHDVTLVIIDTAYHDLARMALEDSCRNAEFSKVIVFTDKPELFDVDETVMVEAHSISDAQKILWYKVPQYISTTHLLTVQWDGWVVNPHLWNDVWLEYDYIGAPWPYEDEFNVGNGGFSLRSKKLMNYLADNIEYEHPEDTVICRKHRKELETKGFKWPNEKMAQCFSFEWLPTKSFGFHGYKGWPLVLSKDNFDHRSKFINNKLRINKKEEECIEYNIKILVESGLGFGFLKDG